MVHSLPGSIQTLGTVSYQLQYLAFISHKKNIWLKLHSILCIFSGSMLCSAVALSQIWADFLGQFLLRCLPPEWQKEMLHYKLESVCSCHMSGTHGRVLAHLMMRFDVKRSVLEAVNVWGLRLHVEFPFFTFWRRLKEVVGCSLTAAAWTSRAQTLSSSSIILPGAASAVLQTCAHG